MSLRNAFGALNLESTQAAISAKLPATLGQKTGANSLAVVLASDQGAVPVSATQSGVWTVSVSGTVPISAVSLPLPTGAATSAAQGTGNASLASIDGKLPALASGRVPVDGSGVTQPVSAAALPLPSGAATETSVAALATATGVRGDTPATDDSGTWSLIALVKRLLGKIPALGQAVMAASLPVVIANNQSAINIVEPAVSITGPAAQTATTGNGQNILETGSGTATNVANYRSASVQVVSTGTAGTFIFEQSNDGTSWQALPVYNAALITGVPIAAAIIATASQIVYTIPIRCNFMRLRIATTITGGTGIQAFTRFSTEPWTPTVTNVAQPTAASLNVSAGLIAGSAAVGDVGIVYRGNATNAASRTDIVSAASTNAAVVKASAGRLLGYQFSNTSASWKYVKLHNQATAPTAGTGVVMTIGIPPNGKAEFTMEGGIAFATGIGVTIVNGSPLTDATAVALGDVVGTLTWV